MRGDSACLCNFVLAKERQTSEIRMVRWRQLKPEAAELEERYEMQSERNRKQNVLYFDEIKGV